ncbi:hypothetical protein WUBG_10259, partial [Wuchereria bancrofti]
MGGCSSSSNSSSNIDVSLFDDLEKWFVVESDGRKIGMNRTIRFDQLNERSGMVKDEKNNGIEG